MKQHSWPESRSQRCGLLVLGGAVCYSGARNFAWDEGPSAHALVCLGVVIGCGSCLGLSGLFSGIGLRFEPIVQILS